MGRRQRRCPSTSRTASGHRWEVDRAVELPTCARTPPKRTKAPSAQVLMEGGRRARGVRRPVRGLVDAPHDFHGRQPPLTHSRPILLERGRRSQPAAASPATGCARRRGGDAPRATIAGAGGGWLEALRALRSATVGQRARAPPLGGGRGLSACAHAQVAAPTDGPTRPAPRRRRSGGLLDTANDPLDTPLAAFHARRRLSKQPARVGARLAVPPGERARGGPCGSGSQSRRGTKGDRRSSHRAGNAGAAGGPGVFRDRGERGRSPGRRPEARGDG